MAAIKLSEQMLGGKIKIGSTAYKVDEIRTSQGIVWPLNVTYTLTNIRISYSGSLNYLHPNANSYYAQILGTLTGTREGQVVSTETVILAPSNRSSNRITISGNYIYWNKATYGTTTLQTGSATVTGTYTIGTQTFTEDNISVSLGANAITSRATTAATVTASTTSIPCTSTTFTIYANAAYTYLNTYTSGSTTTTTGTGGAEVIFDGVSKGTATSTTPVTADASSDNKHSTQGKATSFYAQIYDGDLGWVTSQTYSAMQESDSYTEATTAFSYYINATHKSGDITAAASSTQYNVNAGHLERACWIWRSDGYEEAHGDLVEVSDTWGYYQSSASSTNRFSASQSGNIFTLSHSSMLTYETTDTVGYTFYNYSKQDVKTSEFSFSATNSVVAEDYDVELEVAYTTVTWESRDIGITKSNLLTYPTYSSGSRGAATSQPGYSYLYLTGEGFSFASGRTSVHVKTNLGGDRTGVLSLSWGGHGVSKSITITQTGIETITVTVKYKPYVSTPYDGYFLIDHVLPEDLVIQWEDPIKTQTTYILAGTTITYVDLNGFMCMSETPFVPEEMIEEYEEEKYRRYVFVDGGEV